jgi:plastocyanin
VILGTGGSVEKKASSMFMRIAIATILIAGVHSGAAAAEVHTVAMAGMAYAPAAITARAGDSISFVNDDDADHVVFVPTVGHAIDLGGQKPGEAREMKLMKAGRFEVECANHDHMLLAIEVLP